MAEDIIVDKREVLKLAADIVMRLERAHVAWKQGLLRPGNPAENQSAFSDRVSYTIGEMRDALQVLMQPDNIPEREQVLRLTVRWMLAELELLHAGLVDGEQRWGVRYDALKARISAMLRIGAPWCE